MRVILIFIIFFASFFCFSQETLSEFEELPGKIKLESIKNFNLKLIKEIYRDENNKIVQFYNYDPKTGMFEGDFNNGMSTGTYKNNLMTSENFIYFLNPSETNPLYMKGKIINGRCVGKFEVYQRTFDLTSKFTDQLFDRTGKFINTWNEYDRSIELFTLFNKNNVYTDALVGEIVFNEGIYKSFTYNYENKNYKGDYKNGILEYFVIKDFNTGWTIDSMKLDGKIYMRNGKYKKNDYPKIIDTLELWRNSNINSINFRLSGLDTINFDKAPYWQNLPEIDPINNNYLVKYHEINYWRPIINRENLETRHSLWVNYLSKDLKKIITIPTHYANYNNYAIDGNILGMKASEVDSISICYSLLKIIESYRLKNNTDTIRLIIPFFVYEINLEKIINTSGTINGYKDYYNMIKNGFESSENILYKYTDSIKPRKFHFSYSDISEIKPNGKINIYEIIDTKNKERDKPKKDEENIYVYVPNMPEFPGGQSSLYKYISVRINLPKKVTEEGISGRCFLRFVVGADGKVGKVEINRGVPGCPECDIEATRVIKLLPDFKPALIDGAPVPVWIQIPINFTIK